MNACTHDDKDDDKLAFQLCMSSEISTRVKFDG